jgi:chemotaxis protein MotB
MAKHLPSHGQEHENLERWLITYADMITLLMAFFIMMYAMSILNRSKFAALTSSVRSEFRLPVAKALPGVLEAGEGGGAGGPAPVAARFQLLARTAQALEDNLALGLATSSRGQGRQPRVARAAAKKLMEQVEVAATGKNLVLRLSANEILFPVGSAELTGAARRILDAVAGLLASVPNPVRIEGHTCDLPVHSKTFPSNWELSAQRATNVLTYLLHQGLDPSRLSAAAFADTRPLVPNVDEASRRRNRRVEIVVVGALEGLPEASGAPAAPSAAPASRGGRSAAPAPQIVRDLSEEIRGRFNITSGGARTSASTSPPAALSGKTQEAQP